MSVQFPKDITEPLPHTFSVDKSGLYYLKVVASCQNGGLLRLWGGDLRVEIDGFQLREIPPKDKPQHDNIPPSWNGSTLKGLLKTVIFILPLSQGDHTLIFIPTKTAHIKSFSQKLIVDPGKILFDINEQAQNSDRRPWYTFALINLPLKSISADVSATWHWPDGDDVKLIIDNKSEPNPNSKLWKDWAWSSRPWSSASGEKTFNKNLSSGIHYIEFWADRTPTLRSVILNLGDFKLPGPATTPPPTKRIPSVDDPKWTGDLNDDTEVILLARLIFGEARNQTKETMIAIGWVVKNRLLAKSSHFGSNYHDIILKNRGGIYQFSPMDPTEEKNFPLLIDPLGDGTKTNQEKWLNAYDAALNVINGTSTDPTGRATFFHSSNLSQERFVTKEVPGAVFTKRIGDILFYKDPNEI